MSDELVAVASYLAPVLAEIALSRLRAEGIECFSTGDVSAGTFAGVSGLGGPVAVHVRAADAPRARLLLAELGEPPEPDWEAQAAAEDGVWLCSLCGEPVPLDQSTCPGCEMPRDAVREERSRALPRPRPAGTGPEEGIQRPGQVMTGPPAVPEHELLEDAPEMVDPETFLADELARRALRAAIFGPMACGLFNFYSLWLLFRLCLMPGELSPRSSRRLALAFAINVLVAIFLALVFGSYSWLMGD